MQTKRILIADGEALSRSTLKHNFATLKPEYHVVTATDSFEALGRLMQQPLDLVLIGDHLAGMDRLELAEAIHDILPDLPILLVDNGAVNPFGSLVSPQSLMAEIETDPASAHLLDEIRLIVKQ